MLKTLRYDSVALQYIIDVDKYIASNKEDCDLCQSYMPYCSFCNKWVKNPCAAAYFVGEHFLVVCGIIDQCGVTEPAVIQAIIDVDKYLVSETADFDVCGRYAPFCAVCNKSAPHPCAIAYMRYKTFGIGSELPKIELNTEEQVVEVSAASAAAAATAYEHEISVDAQPYMSDDVSVVSQSFDKSGAEDVDVAPAPDDVLAIPTRRTGIKVATARRRLPVMREENMRIN